MPVLFEDGADRMWFHFSESLVRSIHPFYNEQMVSVSKFSPALIRWLSDHNQQVRFWNADYRVMGVNESTQRPLIQKLSMHRTSIEDAIEHFLFASVRYSHASVVSMEAEESE